MKPKQFVPLLLAVLFLLTGSCKNSGFGATIDGRVYDSATGDPVEGANIRLSYSRGGNGDYGNGGDAKTDQHGYFKIKYFKKRAITFRYYIIAVSPDNKKASPKVEVSGRKSSYTLLL